MPAFTGTLETFSHALITSVETLRECVPHDNALLVFMLQFIACGTAVTYKQTEEIQMDCTDLSMNFNLTFYPNPDFKGVILS